MWKQEVWTFSKMSQVELCELTCFLVFAYMWFLLTEPEHKIYFRKTYSRAGEVTYRAECMVTQTCWKNWRNYIVAAIVALHSWRFYATWLRGGTLKGKQRFTSKNRQELSSSTYNTRFIVALWFFAVLFSIALFVTRQNWFLKQPSAKDYQTTTVELTDYGCGTNVSLILIG